jgi:hypothetical protein
MKLVRKPVLLIEITIAGIFNEINQKIAAEKGPKRFPAKDILLQRLHQAQKKQSHPAA